MTGRPVALSDAAALESLLARLYTDDALRAAFLSDPRGVAAGAGLPGAMGDALATIDRDGLVLAARSLAARRGPTTAISATARAPWWRRLAWRLSRGAEGVR